MTLKEVGVLVGFVVCIALFVIVHDIQISMLFKRVRELQLTEDDFEDENMLES